MKSILLIFILFACSNTRLSAMEKEDEATEREYESHSSLLHEFSGISAIDKAWIFKSHTVSSSASQGIFCVSQPNLLVNKRKKSIVSATILSQNDGSVAFEWAPFPIEVSGVSAMVPSPSGSKLLIVRNAETEGPCRFEIWSSSQLQKEFHIPQSKHGSVYTDGW